jgi:hypothetical protein
VTCNLNSNRQDKINSEEFISEKYITAMNDGKRETNNEN